MFRTNLKITTMKKYIPVLILSITIAILFTYSKISDYINKPENTIALTDNIITIKNNQTLPLSLKHNNELKLVNGEGKFILDKKNDEQQTFSFRNNDSKQVFIKLTSINNTANLRINQIISPTNKSDGPFDRDLVYHLSEKGLYQIKIGENLMQGDPFRGKYTLKLQLK